MSCFPIIFALSMAVGQSNQAADAQPDFNPNLKPIAYMVGDWVMERKSLLGELRSTRRVSVNWAVNKQFLQVNLEETNADGEPGTAGMVIYFWDPELKTIRGNAYFTGNMREEQTLVSSSESEQIWDSKIVFASGNQGRYKCKITHDAKTYTMAWSKVSGSGSADIGPFEHKRVKD